MVIWLRGDAGNVGIESDVIRREDLAMLTDLDRGFLHMQRHTADLLAQAQRESGELIRQAHEQAAAIVSAAEKKGEKSVRLGYAAGYQKGIDEIHAQMLGRSLDDQGTLTLMQDRMAGIVVKAVEQIVDSEGCAGLFRRAAQIVARELENATFMTVSVHPSDVPAARSAFAAAGEEMRRPLQVDVVENRQARPGDCLCEWDYGVLDAGLSQQLQGLRRSLKKAARTSPAPLRSAEPADSFEPRSESEAEHRREGGDGFDDASVQGEEYGSWDDEE